MLESFFFMQSGDGDDVDEDEEGGRDQVFEFWLSATRDGGARCGPHFIPWYCDGPSRDPNFLHHAVGTRQTDELTAMTTGFRCLVIVAP